MKVTAETNVIVRSLQTTTGGITNLSTNAIYSAGGFVGNGSGLTNLQHVLFEASSISNSTASVSPGANTWFPITNTLAFGNVTMAGWTVASNALIYTNSGTAMVHSAITLNVVKTGASSAVAYLKVYKSGSPINSSMQRQFINNTTDYASTALHPTFMATNGTVLQLWGLTTGNDNLLVSDLNWVVFHLK